MSGRSTVGGPRVKRNAEAHGRYTSPTNKKPRFDYRNPSTLAPDAPEEDAILELDEIGKGGQQTKRNAVNLDGYETDSSTENFDSRADAKAELARQEGRRKDPNLHDGDIVEKGVAGWNRAGETGKSKDEEDNDMFADMDEDMEHAGGGADGDDDEELSREGKKKKDVRFMDVEDIEGQISSSRSGGHVRADFELGRTGKGKGKLPQEQDKDADSSSESGSDEERDRLDPEDEDAEELGAGSKKHHAPKLDAFNMKQEGEEGRFDESGNFIRKARDPDSVHDSWLEGLNKKDMKAARDAQEKREEDRRRKQAEDDIILTSDLLGTLIGQLEKGETILEALQRVGAGSKQKKKAAPKWKKNKKSANGTNGGEAMDLDATKDAEDPAETRRRQIVETITGAADQLFSRDQPEIYDQEREVLMRQYKRETGEDWVDNRPREPEPNGSEGAQWEYRWSDTRDGGESHGPYDGPTMQAWNTAGYFGEGVEFRRIGDLEWSRSVDFV